MSAGPGGQRIVATPQNGPVMMARPQGQSAQLINGHLVRTSGGGVLVGGQRPGNPANIQQQIMRPGGGGMSMVPSTGTVATQNVVIRQNGLRPGQPGTSITVPLSTLQSLQAGQGIPTGQPGHLLVRTESGQYQILRVGPQPTTQGVAVSSAPAHPQQPTPQPPTVVRSVGTPAPGTPSSPIVVRQNGPLLAGGQVRPVSVGGGLVQHQPPLPPPSGSAAGTINTVVRNQGQPVQPISQPTPSSQAPSSNNSMGQQMTPDTAKTKCKNFLATLLRLASDQPDSVAKNVRALIQGLIDGRVEPEDFTTRLQKELNSSPQPCLVPFLKRSLPYLQQSLATNELKIEGVRAPAMSQVGKLPPAVSSAMIAAPLSLSTSSAAPLRLPQQPSVAPVRPPPPTVTPSITPSVASVVATPAPPTPRPTISRPVMSMNSVSRLSMPQLPPNLSIKHPVPPVREKKSSNSYSAAGDDDINDVAAMGGVNLQEEANSILGTSDNVGTVIRSCKDETFLQTGLLHQKISRICREKGLEGPSNDVISLVSHATQDRLKTLVSKLSVIAEHRLDIIKAEGPYEVTSDVKGQLRFLEDLDKMEKKRQEEFEREQLIRAAKSRTKTDDPEKEKMKIKAKELQKLEQEQQRHSEANATALAAIGGSKAKKFKFDETSKPGGTVPMRPRIKRVHLRDVIFLMEQEKELRSSELLYRSYCS